MFSLQDNVRLGRSEAERIREFLSNLSSDQLSMPSACTEWQVGDVVGHLTWVGEFYTDLHNRALQDVTDPPVNSPGGSGNRWGSNDKFFAQTAIDTRQRLGDELLPRFAQVYEELFQLFSRLQPVNLDKPCYLPAGNRPLQYLMVMTIQELAVHSWDLRSGIESSAHFSPEVLPVLMERISHRPLPNLVLGPQTEDPVRYRFELTGPSARTIDYLFESGKGRAEPAGEIRPTESYRCNTDAFVPIMYGRVRLDEAISKGLVERRG